MKRSSKSDPVRALGTAILILAFWVIVLTAVIAVFLL